LFRIRLWHCGYWHEIYRHDFFEYRRVRYFSRVAVFPCSVLTEIAYRRDSERSPGCHRSILGLLHRTKFQRGDEPRTGYSSNGCCELSMQGLTWLNMLALYNTRVHGKGRVTMTCSCFRLRRGRMKRFYKPSSGSSIFHLVTLSHVDPHCFPLDLRSMTLLHPKRWNNDLYYGSTQYQLDGYERASRKV
jgi:hypothetical protein